MKTAALECRMHRGAALDITDGCRALFKAYAHARRFNIHFDTLDTYWKIIAAIGRASHVSFVDGERDWHSTSAAWIKTVNTRTPSTMADPSPHSSN